MKALVWLPILALLGLGVVRYCQQTQAAANSIKACQTQAYAQNVKADKYCR